MAKIKEKEISAMSNYNQNGKEFVTGAVIGGILGGAAGLLFAPKAGCDLRHDIADATRKGQCLAKNVTSQTKDFAGKARGIFSNFSQGFSSATADEAHPTRNFIIGSVTGGLLGAATALALAPKSGQKLRQDISDTYEDVSEKTREFAGELSKKGRAFAKNVNVHSTELSELLKEVADRVPINDNMKDKLDDVIEWASLGMRLWQNIKKRG
jgi:gas vesicle protein